MNENDATEIAYKNGAKDMADRVKEIASGLSLNAVQFTLFYYAIEKAEKEMGCGE